MKENQKKKRRSKIKEYYKNNYKTVCFLFYTHFSRKECKSLYDCDLHTVLVTPAHIFRIENI